MTTATLEKSKKETGATQTATRKTVVPHYKVDQQEDVFLVSLMLPGVDEGNLHLEADGQWLKIKASPTTLDNKGFHAAHLEFTERDYEAEFRIPDSIDRNKISGRLVNGVLKVTLPKGKEHQRHAIKIDAS